MSRATVLAVGGAGYIGSHMVQFLLDQGCHTVTFDDLSTGFRDAVMGGDFVHGSLASESGLDSVFASDRFDAVMHFASFVQVGESVSAPSLYYRNNLGNGVRLLGPAGH